MLKRKTGGFGRFAALPTSKRMANAIRLVQRTLSQHGLLTESAGMKDGLLRFTKGDLPQTLPADGLTSKAFKKHAPLLPDGARFHTDVHSCGEGSRTYRTYIPASASQGLTGLVMMLHGCTQTAEDFAAGTGMNELAEQRRFAVVYPQQSRGQNAQSCWNWFNPSDQARDHGEPAILAGLTRTIVKKHQLVDAPVFVAGLSAGAAMAVILGAAYPEIFTAVGAHSGLPLGAAKNVSTAFAAMAGNVTPATTESSNRAHRPTIIFHGTADNTVHPSNSERIAARVLGELESDSSKYIEEGETAGRRYTKMSVIDTDRATKLEHWTVHGLGHAWSGGNSIGSYTDDLGPSASDEMIRFFLDST